MSKIESRPPNLRGAGVLVIGGAGMIGSAVSHLAVAAGAKVTIVDNMSPNFGANLFNLEDIRSKIKLVRGDVRDYDLMADMLRGQDIVYNMAAQVSRHDSIDDPLLDLDINCRGHLTVLEACRKLAHKARFVFPSTRMVYGNVQKAPVDESHRLQCERIYPLHKRVAENYYEFYHQTAGIEAAVLRIANPYGPGQQMRNPRYGVLNWFVRQALSDRAITIYGDGRQLRDYIFIDDLARVMLAAGTAPIRYGLYNIGSGRGASMREVAETVVAAVGRGEIKHTAWPADALAGETGDYVSDITKAERELGWRPSVTLEAGIGKTAAYYRRHAEQYGFEVARTPAKAR